MKPRSFSAPLPTMRTFDESTPKRAEARAPGRGVQAASRSACSRLSIDFGPPSLPELSATHKSRGSSTNPERIESSSPGLRAWPVRLGPSYPGTARGISFNPNGVVALLPLPVMQPRWDSAEWIVEPVGSFHDLQITHRGQEPRASVLDCGPAAGHGPLALSDAPGPSKSARGLAQSKTWRPQGRFLENTSKKWT